MAYEDLAGDIAVYDYRITYGVPSLSTDKQSVIIPYNGIADPALTSALVVYKYSLDNGTSWSDMTPSSTTQLTGLSFTASGTSLSFEWESKADIGVSMYNTTIRIKLQAQSGSLTTAEATYNLYFERTSTNLAQQADSAPFPDDYSGIPGNELLVNAPKLGS